MKQSAESKKKSKIDENFIAKKCEELLKEASIVTPPVDPRVLASFRDIRSVSEMEMKECGRLQPLENGGAEIFLRRTDSKQRQNFTCAHEITHTFFPEYELKPQLRVDTEVGHYNQDEEIEYLCDYGASMLLLPDFLFIPEYEKRGFSIKGLKEMAEIFDTSLQATAIKMVKKMGENAAVILWEECLKPTEEVKFATAQLPGIGEAPEKKPRIKFSYGIRKIWHIPKYKS